MRHVISVLMENESGALSRVVGLFSARGYNIDSLSVNVTDDKTLSRLTLTTQGDERMLEQILKQLNKLIEVVKVCDLNQGKFTERELILIKIRATAKDRREFLELIQIYRGNTVDVTERTLTAEITGSSDKIDSFIDLISKTNILEIVRTGAVGLGCGERTMKV
ncbi:MAG: acetolactate synthase small subunit [Neisseriaceae bacterium]|nr:MAG: acetolactate synthase small subunit [Neisseriaceae bacterium]